MNEFNAQTGGRYVYVDDVLNLQNLALAFGKIFDECDNFIVSGCQVSGSTISAGYIYLNGKLRYFSGASGISKWPQYLYEKNSTESVNYASGNTKVGRNIYGVSIGSSVPTTSDPLTGKVPVSMQITSNGGTLMKDAFFGKYAVILNAANLMQVLNGSLKITGDLEIGGNIKSLANRYRIIESLASFDAYFGTKGMSQVASYSSSGNNYSITMEDGLGFGFYINDVLVARISKDGINGSGFANTKLGSFGCVGVDNSGVYNRTEATNAAALNINMVGYNGSTQYYRNTNIGNGKGTAIIAVNGQSNAVRIAGVTTIASGSTNEGLVFLLDKPKTTTSIQKSVIWKDSNAEVMGVLGFTETTDLTFRITNNLAGVYIYGASGSFVDLGPAIKENGQYLKDKYVLKSDYNSTYNTLAKSNDVYTKVQADGRYAQLSNGFADYIAAGKTQATLRQQIGALGAGDLADYVKKSSYLSDMATTETAKQKIRENIGAAANGDFQTKLKDSGWVLIKRGLYIRQIGNVVSIQGSITTIHSGTLFTIPNTIDPPTHAVYQSFSFSNSRNWTVSIKANSRSCNVLYCSGSCGNTTDFSITYMV